MPTKAALERELAEARALLTRARTELAEARAAGARLRVELCVLLGLDPQVDRLDEHILAVVERLQNRAPSIDVVAHAGRDAEEVRQGLIELAALAGHAEEWHEDADHASLLDYIRQMIVRASSTTPDERKVESTAIVGPSIWEWLKRPWPTEHA